MPELDENGLLDFDDGDKVGLKKMLKETKSEIAKFIKDIFDQKDFYAFIREVNRLVNDLSEQARAACGS